MTLFDAIDREGASTQWLSLVEGDVHDGFPLVASGELCGRVTQYLGDKKHQKHFYAEHAKYFAYAIARLCLSDYRTDKRVHVLYKLIVDTPAYVYTLPLVAENKEPNVSNVILDQLEHIAKRQPKLFTINRNALTDSVAEAYQIAWPKQATCHNAARLLNLINKYATFSKIQQRHFDSIILRKSDELSAWYAKARDEAIKKKLYAP